MDVPKLSRNPDDAKEPLSCTTDTCYGVLVQGTYRAMKTFAAFVLGGAVVFGVMMYHYHASAPVVSAPANPTPVAQEETERASLQDQLACSSATELYADANFGPKESVHTAATGTVPADFRNYRSHYDPKRRRCVGVVDYQGHIVYRDSYAWFTESIDAFDPVEGKILAGGTWEWKSSGTGPDEAPRGFPTGMTSEENNKAVANRGVSMSEFNESLEKQYGVKTP